MSDHAELVPDSANGPREHSFVVERDVAAPPSEVFDAWVYHFDTWFASPGAISMGALAGSPFWFDVVHEGQHYAHYGRYLRVERDRVVELTWVTGHGGTDGAETVVTVELSPSALGTKLRLTHGGFYDEESARRHRDSWPQILEHLDHVLSGAD